MSEVLALEWGAQGLDPPVMRIQQAKTDAGVRNTVRDLVAGADVAFEPRGEHTLKGVPGTWALFALLDNPVKRPRGHEIETQSEPLPRNPASQAG